MLSEGSLFTFDALINNNEPDIDLPGLQAKHGAPPRDTREVLSLLMQATLGSTTTGGIVWDRKENKFRWSLAGGRMLGLQIKTASL